LPTPGGPRKQRILIEFAHRQIFDQPFFNFFQIVMIAVEDFLRLVEIKIVLAQLVPGQIGDDLDVTDDDREFRTCRRNKIEPFQFPLRLFHHFLWRFGFLEPSAQLLGLFFTATFGFAKLALDRLDLRTEISASLRIGKLRGHIFLQLLLNLGDLELRRDLFLNCAYALFDVELFEQRLLLRDIHV